jgi:hypothetical protein
MHSLHGKSQATMSAVPKPGLPHQRVCESEPDAIMRRVDTS